MDIWKNQLIDEWILTELNEGENYEQILGLRVGVQINEFL